MPYKDPEKRKEYKRNHYLQNKSRYHASAKASLERRRDYSRSLMTPCVDCGAFDVRFMDWHHIDPSNKSDEVANIIKGRNKHEILEEINKCVCLCSNCHRIRHS